MSVIKPHSNRLRRRSSNVGISLGGRSEEMTSWRLASYSALNVWKNSSWVDSLPCNELNIVDEQHVHIAVLVAELHHGFSADGSDEVISKSLRGYIDYVYTWISLQSKMSDRVHQVSLP
jgi:hypothetical protein